MTVETRHAGILTLALGLAGLGAFGRVAEPVTIDRGLVDWQILQQDEKGQAEVELSGRWAAEGRKKVNEVLVRVTTEDDRMPVSCALDWHAVDTATDKAGTNGTWTAKLVLPRGGLYRVETLLRRDNGRLDWSTAGAGVSHVGVGDVWIIAGQSNADGNGRSAAYDPPELGIHQFRHRGDWSLAVHPLHDNTKTAYGAYATANHSPWLAFARTLRRKLGYPIGLVPAALGGSAIAEWLPEKNGHLFRTMLQVADDACARKVKGVVWFQGCTDTLTEDGKDYAPLLKSFVCQLRDALGQKLPIVSVQINRVNNHPAGFWTPPRWDLIREAQRRVAHETEAMYLVSAFDLGLDDCIHHTSNANILLGERCAATALGMVYGRDVDCRCPDFARAVIAADRKSVKLRFAGVRGTLLWEPRDKRYIPFQVTDADGEVPLEKLEVTAPDTLTLTFGRAVADKIRVVGAPGNNPPYVVPKTVPGYRPMLAFTADVAYVAPRPAEHPDSTGAGWEDVFGRDLSNAECAKPGWAWDAQGFLTPGTEETLFSKRDYRDFVLDLAYVMDPTANSGVFLYDTKHPTHKFEIQILDDANPAYGDEVPYQNTGAIYGRCAPRTVATKPAGELNRMTCWCRGTKVRVVVNGEEVIDADLADWKDPLVNPDGTRVPKWHEGFPALGTIPMHGRIALQGIHGGKAAHFKYLRVKPLD